MNIRTVLFTAMAAACCLNACGRTQRASAEPKSAAASGRARAAPQTQPGAENAQDADRLLREVERTVANPVPRPMIPLLELEAGGPAGGEIR
jgi:hypothetical protein